MTIAFPPSSPPLIAYTQPKKKMEVDPKTYIVLGRIAASRGRSAHCNKQPHKGWGFLAALMFA